MKNKLIHLNTFKRSTIGGVLWKFLAKFNKMKQVSSVTWKIAYVKEMHGNCLQLSIMTTFQILLLHISSAQEQDTVTSG